MKLFFCDTETTQLENPRMVSLAYRIQDTSTLEDDEFYWLFNPGELITVEAMSVNHITNKMIERAPIFKPESIQKYLNEFVFVAHNAPFDIKVLKNEGCIEPKYFIDTKRVAMHLFDLDSYRLQYLRYFFELEVEGEAHTADGDVNVLNAVFDRLYEATMEYLEDTYEKNVIAQMIRFSTKPVLLKRLNFGKHEGKTFEELAKTSKDYFLWCKKKYSENPEGKEDLLFTLDFYLNA